MIQKKGEKGEAQTLLKLFRSYMKPVFVNQVTWNNLQKYMGLIY